MHGFWSVVCTVRTRCTRCRARYVCSCTLSCAVLRAVMSIELSKSCDRASHSATLAIIPVATRNVLSRQTFLSSLSRQRILCLDRGGLVPCHDTISISRHKASLPCPNPIANTIQGRDLVTRGPFRDREPPVATLVAQSQLISAQKVLF